MLSKKGGGIEQSMVDYCLALSLFGHQAIAITPPRAWVNNILPDDTEKYHLKNWGAWDIFAALKLRKILLRTKPDIIITHTNRALTLTLKAIKGKIPIIAVAHNYKIKQFIKADAVFTITQDLAGKVADLGVKSQKIFHIPNMIKASEPTHKEPHNPLVIGALGRFVHKKGFAIYLQALKILKEQGIEFKALLGGAGEESENLQQLAQQLGLQENLEFIGWVEDRAEFYNRLDIFCLPSLHEPFGIVLLEAFAHKVAVVSTNSEGPIEIATPNEDALLVEKNDAVALANALKKLLADEILREYLRDNAYKKICANYTHQIVGAKISAALTEIRNT